MAKAQFHKNQKVWVETVGAWAVIEKIVPVWAKGFEEPVRITYEVGLGRDFHGHELRSEDPADEVLFDPEGGPPGGSCAPATSGSRRKTAPTTPIRAPSRWW